MSYDIIPIVSTALAITTVVTAFGAVAWDQWTSYRKRARRRVGALVAQANWDPEKLSHTVVGEFASAHFENLQEQEELKLDLERLALLAVMDEKLIDKTVKEIEAVYRTAHLEAFAKTRLLEFSLDWLTAQRRLGALPLPQLDALRGEYEYNKKRKVLFHALHKAFA